MTGILIFLTTTYSYFWLKSFNAVEFGNNNNNNNNNNSFEGIILLLKQ